MRHLVALAAVLCLTIWTMLSALADDEAGSSSRRTEDEFVTRPAGDRAARSPRIREYEATGRNDVLILKNGNRFEGLILDESVTQINFARYSSRVVSPHTLRISKGDIVGIERVRPEWRASLEAEVRELLDNTRLARQQAEIERWREAEMARQQQLAEAAMAFQKSIQAMQRKTPTTTPNSGSFSRERDSRTRASAMGWSGRPSRTPRFAPAVQSAPPARRVASVSTPRVRAAGKG